MGNEPKKGNNRGNNRGRRNNNRKRRNYRGRSNNRNESDVVKKYQNLLELHLAARRKYFELYHRADPNQKAKLERNFNKTIEALREFEKLLPEGKKQTLEVLTEGYDREYTYAQNHNLPLETPDDHDVGEIQDPHYLETQKSANYAEDTEESVGSMEDYYSYKGIRPPDPEEEETH